MQNISSLLLCLALLIHVLGCAGPTGPFGPVPMEFSPPTNQQAMLRAPASSWDPFAVEPDVSIALYPRAQRYHEPQDFRIVVYDQQGIHPLHHIRLYHNEQDVTESFMGFARAELSESRTRLELTFPNLRLPVRRAHDILVTYQRSAPQSITHYARFAPPSCAFKTRDTIAQAGRFNRHWGVLRKIEHFSREQGINPNFMAALVAQESSFNPKAVSWAKAIGLTQVTDLAAQHVLEEEDKQSWPSFELIREMSYPAVKASIMTGKINSSNEWRLHVEKSLQGGLTYLQYLEDYWNLPHHWDQLQKVQGSITRDSDSFAEVILASYNSGPFRVRRAMANLGTRWLDSPDLTEASRYVRSVQSYCDQFSHTLAEAR
jgi:soluble lytic murein transglycosylase-like protein